MNHCNKRNNYEIQFCDDNNGLSTASKPNSKIKLSIS